MINKKIDCLIENANTDFEIDVDKWTQITKQLFQNLLTHDEIAQDYCLKGLQEKYDEIFFDITFTDAQETHELNKTYREKDYPADIITFALFADSEDELIIERKITLGDIIIALDKVQQMAQEEGKSFEWELKFLIAHGILHLLGFDHTDEDEYNFVVRHQNLAIEELNDKI